MSLLHSPLRADRERDVAPHVPHAALPAAQNAGKGPTACEHSRDREVAPWAIARASRAERPSSAKR